MRTVVTRMIRAGERVFHAGMELGKADIAHIEKTHDIARLHDLGHLVRAQDQSVEKRLPKKPEAASVISPQSE